jgi:hypothetical protein
MYLDPLAIYFAQMNQTVSSLLGMRPNAFANIHVVDICITTDWKEMEGVCIIADLLAKSEQPQSNRLQD